MKKIFSILFIMFACASCLPSNYNYNKQQLAYRNIQLQEKPNHEYATEEEKQVVEQLLVQKKYTEAEQRNIELFKNLPTHSGQPDVYECYFLTGMWLRKTDNMISVLKKANENIDTYENEALNNITPDKSFYDVCSSHDVSELNSGIPSRLPFTSGFVDYINQYKQNAFSLCQNTNKRLSDLRIAQRDLQIKIKNDEIEHRREQEILKQEEERVAREQQELEREQKESERKQVIVKENTKLNNLARKAGYAGYNSADLVSFIRNTQINGGLENYLNQIIGCNELEKDQCDYYYKGLKAIQILDDGVLYSYSAYYGDQYLDFVVYINKENGKLYQEGQSCNNRLFVFKGMFSYVTVSGSKKSVPSFANVIFGR